MPYKSLAQERYFNAHKKALEAQGVNVNEWNNASKGKKLLTHNCPSCKKNHKVSMKSNA